MILKIGGGGRGCPNSHNGKSLSSARNCADHHERFFSRSDAFGQRLVGRFVRPVFFANKETKESSALLGYVITNRTLQRRIACFQRVQDRARRHRRRDLQFHRTADLCQVAQVIRQLHANHGSVCTSTESTAGRSWVMAFQLSPSSLEQYTCPPLVPK